MVYFKHSLILMINVEGTQFRSQNDIKKNFFLKKGIFGKSEMYRVQYLYKNGRLIKEFFFRI